MQVVTCRSGIVVGHTVLIALPGTVLENGKLVRCEKLGGEWSEGALIDVVDAGSQSIQGEPQNASCKCVSHDDCGAAIEGCHDGVGLAEYEVLPCSLSEMRTLDTGGALGTIRYV